MKQYTSCFIGIPLPEKFQKEFERLLDDIGKLYPLWEVTYPKTPHVTVYYLDKQSQNVLLDIQNIIKEETSNTRGFNLEVSGFDYFTRTDPREGIIFLNIVYPAALINLNKELAKKLNPYNSNDNNLPFHPHITVAMVNGLKEESELKCMTSALEQKISKINWKFLITEIVIYGVDSIKRPQYQEKLIHIPVK